MWTAKAQARLEHPAGMAGMGGWGDGENGGCGRPPQKRRTGDRRPSPARVAGFAGGGGRAGRLCGHRPRDTCCPGAPPGSRRPSRGAREADINGILSAFCL